MAAVAGQAATDVKSVDPRGGRGGAANARQAEEVRDNYVKYLTAWIADRADAHARLATDFRGKHVESPLTVEDSHDLAIQLVDDAERRADMAVADRLWFGTRPVSG
jgi:hypothetical protein